MPQENKILKETQSKKQNIRNIKTVAEDTLINFFNPFLKRGEFPQLILIWLLAIFLNAIDVDNFATCSLEGFTAHEKNTFNLRSDFVIGGLRTDSFFSSWGIAEKKLPLPEKTSSTTAI